MTDLTKQWKKGELPDGIYYVELIGGNSIIAYIHRVHTYKNKTVCKVKAFNGFITKNQMKSVLSKVPTYEEWQSMDRLEKIMLQERARLNKQVIELLEENTKLKELLKQARESVYVERACDNSLGDTIWNYTTRLINEINQALGEDR